MYEDSKKLRSLAFGFLITTVISLLLIGESSNFLHVTSISDSFFSTNFVTSFDIVSVKLIFSFSFLSSTFASLFELIVFSPSKDSLTTFSELICEIKSLITSFNSNKDQLAKSSPFSFFFRQNAKNFSVS